MFGRQKLWREMIEGLMRSSFNENPIFPVKYDRLFEQRRNAAGELGYNTYQKVTNCNAGRSMEFKANGHKYNYGYFLTDNIYSRWQTFVKPVIQPRGKKQTQFYNAQAVGNM